MRTAFSVTALIGLALASWRLSSAAPATPTAATAAPAPAPAAATTDPTAAALYDRFCLACHGSAGDGNGPAAPWLWPRPRDFTRGELKWRSTTSGKPATDADIATAIRYGVPGTSMHAFAVSLDDAQVTALVGLVKAFAADVYAEPAAPLATAPRPAINAALIARGKQAFTEVGCVQCHGAGLRGDGASAKTLRDSRGLPAAPYDLTAQPLRRPRADAGGAGDDAVGAIYLDLLTGLSGTSMPSYSALPPSDLWALAAYVDSLRFRGTRGDPTTVDPIAIELDTDRHLTRTGYWPGTGAADGRAWGHTLTFQREPPPGLAPAQASLRVEQCGRCHAKQVREWTGSLHSEAASPGLLAQVIEHEKSYSWVESCQRCHAPLPEQLPNVRAAHSGGPEADHSYGHNPLFSEELRHQAINCAACHVRENWQRLGPRRNPGNGLLSLPGYPMVETPIYERADLCLGCHQLPPRLSINGKPLLNTYREWLEGPYMRRGIECQHCHMPNREHTFLGVHDPDTFRQGIELEAIAGRSGSGTVSVRARLRNVGAGHYLPTTTTPAAWIVIDLVDADGKPIDGAHAEKRIGRYLQSGPNGWHEIEDTRIPPGQSTELAAAWKDGRVAQATRAHVVIRVHPDDYYEGFYEARLRGKHSAVVRAMYQAALKRARGNRYVALDEMIPIARSGK